MRENYTLSDETRAVFSAGKIKEIAEELDKHPSFFYNIMAGNETDPFSKFIPVYKACVRLGLPVDKWLNRLISYQAKFVKEAPNRSATEQLALKIHCDAQTTTLLLAALENGRIDPHEIPALEESIAEEQHALDSIRTLIQLARAENE